MSARLGVTKKGQLVYYERVLQLLGLLIGDDPETMSLLDAAKLRGVSKQSLWGMAVNGKLPVVTLPTGEVRVKRSDLLALPPVNTTRQRNGRNCRARKLAQLAAQATTVVVDPLL